MNKYDWVTFDDLLSKEGFGGYYDLMECLYTITEKHISKMIGQKLREDKAKLHSTINIMMLMNKRKED